MTTATQTTNDEVIDFSMEVEKAKEKVREIARDMSGISQGEMFTCCAAWAAIISGFVQALGDDEEGQEAVAVFESISKAVYLAGVKDAIDAEPT